MVNVEEMGKMSTSDLSSFLIEEVNISPEDTRELQGEFLIKAHQVSFPLLREKY